MAKESKNSLEETDIGIGMAKYEGYFKDNYSGSPNEDLDVFLSRFELNAKLRDFAPNKIHLALSLRLTGNAAIWLATLDESTKATYEGLKSALIDNFQGKNQKWVNETKLASRTQRESESLDDYFSDISSLSHKLQKSDQERLTHFIRGLQPPLKAFVISKEPDSLSRALHYARLAQIVAEPSVARSAHSTQVASPHPNPNHSSMDNATAIQQLHCEIAQLKTVVNDLANPPPFTHCQQNWQGPQNAQQNERGSHSGSYSKQNRIICFRCGKPGHMQFACHSKFHIQGYPLN